MSRVIPLTRGRMAVVDDRDADWLSKWKWCAYPHRRTWYAMRAERIEPGRGGCARGHLMHRCVLGLKHGDGRLVDHINGDGLDNRRANLRICTSANSSMNRGPHGRRPYKGLRRSKRGWWDARIGANGRSHWLGTFPTMREAAHAYDDAARQLHGEYARLNFPTLKEQR